MTHLVHLVEITAVVDGAGTTTVLRYTDGAGYNHPSAPGYYAPRLKEAPAMWRDAWSDGTTGGRSRVGYGILSLVNVDGALDQGNRAKEHFPISSPERRSPTAVEAARSASGASLARGRGRPALEGARTKPG